MGEAEPKQELDCGAGQAALTRCELRSGTRVAGLCPEHAGLWSPLRAPERQPATRCGVQEVDSTPAPCDAGAPFNHLATGAVLQPGRREAPEFAAPPPPA